VLRLFDVEGKETRWARADLASVRPTELSLMPSGLLDGRKENDVRDLLTFLMWAPPDRDREKLPRRAEPGGEPPSREIRLVLVASKQDHGSGQHDYPRWQTNWSRWLSNAAQRTVTETAWEWPSAAQFSSASVLVFYYWNHDWSAARLAQLDAFLERGGGVVLIHSAVITDREPEALAARFGLSSHPVRTGYRHMPLDLELVDRDHPITRGLPARIYFLDEPYWPLIGDPADVHVLASAKVDGALRPLIWTHQKGAGRVFASILGHYTWSLEDPWLRTILLRGIAWAGGEAAERLDTLAPAAK
jgi:type 1 glutamine amidotransferase